jgi:hypothetical protein
LARLSLILVFGVVLLPAGVRAQGGAPGSEGEILEPPPFSGAAFYLEEDAFNRGFRITDQNYTGGGAFQFAGSFIPRAHLTAPLDVLDWVFGIRALQDALTRQGTTLKGYGLALGVTVFTPKDLRTSDPIPLDRPYAALDFLTVTRTSVSERLDLALSTEFTVGALGLETGHWFQSTIHRIIRNIHNCPDEVACSPPDPKGWGHQVSNGGEPTARYGVLAEKLLSQWRSERLHFGYDLKATGKAEIGYSTAANAGGAIRVGFINSPFWLYNTAPLSSVNQIAVTQRIKASSPPHPELYAWAGLRGRLVGYNALLQGQFRHSDVMLSEGEIERFMYEYEAGITAGLYGFNFTWVVIAGRSPEFDTGTPRHHLWSSFYLSWRALPP